MKKRPAQESTGNWMDTYGDLVTLLLTFFVMLYAMSSVNQQKWEVFVKSIYPSSTETEENVAINAPVGEGSDAMTGSVKTDGIIPEPMEADTLYLALVQKLEELGVDGVTISRGADYTFIVFEDKTFFDGDSSVLTEQGKATLDVFCQVVAPAKQYVSQINIMGHTAQGDPGKPNNPRTDRMLSAMRAAEVCIYIQAKDAIEPEKLVSMSYGQFRPVDTSNTREGRARNRRVELLMLDEGADMRSLNDYYNEYNSDVNQDAAGVTDGAVTGDGAGFVPAQSSPTGVSANMSPVDDYVQKPDGEVMPPQDGGTDGSAPTGEQAEGAAE